MRESVSRLLTQVTQVFKPHPNLSDVVNHNIVQSEIEGSTWGGSMMKLRYIGRGMCLEFRHPDYRAPIVTSRIQTIQTA